MTNRFQSGGNKTIKLRLSALGKNPVILTKNVYVKPYPINLSRPDGDISPKVTLSTPTSALITNYQWNYGDGSPAATW
ncbi:MAG: hypothetical protein HC887_09855 [Desulfobacteraceae bacterium]|nr:hypothetical protein [Desulfobacteraceae bacterium]